MIASGSGVSPNELGGASVPPHTTTPRPSAQLASPQLTSSQLNATIYTNITQSSKRMLTLVVWFGYMFLRRDSSPLVATHLASTQRSV